MTNIDNAACLVTGASRGLGASLARALDTRGASLFLVARSAIVERYRDAQAVAADLSDPYSIDDLLDGFTRFVAERSPRCLLVLNNAGTVAPIAPAWRCDAGQVDAAIRLNLTAPMLVTGGFIRRFADADLPKLVVNVSSGAASTPYHGWSTYCAGKAGLDHFTRCAGLEQRGAPNPATVIAIAPGVVDTAMQDAIRASDPADFPQIGKFTALKEGGTLATPRDAAEAMIRLIETTPLQNGGVYDVRTR